MCVKRNYINPRVVEAAMQVLSAYKDKHPNEAMPLFAVCKTSDTNTRAAYTRAAQRLGWKVTRSKGHVYENGQFIW